MSEEPSDIFAEETKKGYVTLSTHIDQIFPSWDYAHWLEGKIKSDCALLDEAVKLLEDSYSEKHLAPWLVEKIDNFLARAKERLGI